MQRVDDIAPTLTSPILSGFVNSVRSGRRPEVPKESVPPKIRGSLQGHSQVPTGPDAPGPSFNGVLASQVYTAEVEAEVSKLYEEGGVDPDQTLPVITPEDAAIIIISDDDEIDFSIDVSERVSTPKAEPNWKQK